MLCTVTLLPLSHLSGGSFSAQGKEIQVHTRTLHTSFGPASTGLLAAVLLGILISGSSVLRDPSCWEEEAQLKSAPSESSHRYTGCLYQQALLQRGRRAVWDNSIWPSWTEGYELFGVFFYGLGFASDYSVIPFRHKSGCLHCGRGRSFLKNTGTSGYKMMPPSPASIIAIHSWREVFISWAG